MRIVHCIRLMFVAMIMLAMSARSFAQIGVSITFGPPELPIYDQPPCPEEGYIWTPGYWAWDEGDYYWVPGTWVLAPEVGVLWTPGYWGWGGDRFVFYDGYWGREVGFYGGINYGYGYSGRGYEGGRWDHDQFFYNRSVNNVNVTNIRNVYNTTVINNNTNVTRVSYNGGNGGVNERPTSREDAAAHERHIAPPSAQVQHIQAARSNPELKASVNRGRPPIAATPRPAAFNDRAVVAAKEGGRYNPPPNLGANTAPRTENGGNSRPENSASRPANVVHPRDLPPVVRPAISNTGNQRQDQKLQQQQEKLIQKQDQDRQRLQQKQDQEHQRLAQQKADDATTQQVERRHQQQTQQLQQKHETQQQKLQAKQPSQQPKPSRPPG